MGKCLLLFLFVVLCTVAVLGEMEIQTPQEESALTYLFNKAWLIWQQILETNVEVLRAGRTQRRTRNATFEIKSSPNNKGLDLRLNVRDLIIFCNQSDVCGRATIRVLEKAKFRLRIRRIFSYIPRNKTGKLGFQRGEDRVTKSCIPGRRRDGKSAWVFSPPTKVSLAPANASQPAVDGWKFVVTAPICVTNGSIKLTFTIAKRTWKKQSTENETLVFPNSGIQMDLAFEGFPFTTPAADIERIAMSAVFRTRKNSKWKKDSVNVTGQTQPEQAVNINSGSAYFTWAPNAVADGTNKINVLSSLISKVSKSDRSRDDNATNYKSQQVIFSFMSNKPKSILWDPRVGTNSGAALVISFMLLILLFACLA